MKKTIYIILLIVSILSIISCKRNSHQHQVNIVPRPQHYEPQDGFFELNRNTIIALDSDKNSDAVHIADFFCRQIRTSTGFPISSDVSREKNVIIFRLTDNDAYENEGYLLTIDKQKIIVEASKPSGLFYGMQSLLQLFPPEIFSEKKQEHILWQAPCLIITDKPHFQHRGAHLDVCRHFFTLDSVKRYIDHLARYKMNRFHWHLTDDQGWRIEIKQYPKLTETGSCRKETLIGSYADTPHRYNGTEYCGFYTQDEAREIVRYAAERFITVIPEIEMPGHALAALSAYPELSCDPKKQYEAATTWGVFEDVFCPSETTFTFLENVLTEIMDIFPSEYIHIGGDECPKKAWKESRFCQDFMKKNHLKDEEALQHYFIQRMAEFLGRHNRKIIGWDEILEGGIAQDATIMSWRGFEGGIEATQQGHNVIMTPTSYCYLDYYQANPQTEPLAIGGFVTLNKVYHFNPVPPQIPEDKKYHILGVQCNLWTEYIPTFRKVEYMLLPRLLAMSEVAWSTPEQKGWDDFCRRLPYQLQILDALHANYGTISFNIQFKALTDSIQGKYFMALSSEIAGAEIAYTIDGTMPDIHSTRYVQPVEIQNTCMIKAVPVFDGKIMESPVEKEITYHKAIGKKVVYLQNPDSKYPAGGNHALVDGMHGSFNFADGFWQGFFGYDCDVIIDLDSLQKISKIAVTALQSTTSWILFPKQARFYCSTDKQDWKTIGVEHNTVDPFQIGHLKKTFSVDIKDETPYQYIRVAIESPKACPQGHAAEGSPCWIFVDEIEIE